jgi:23S rRNA (cytosine1962-C5)-methyltransferase
MRAIDQDFFVKRISRALQLRQALFHSPYYRLVFAESDGLAGLVVDRYGDVLVVQLTTAGTESLKPLILEALQTVIQPSGIVIRNNIGVRELEGLTVNQDETIGMVPEFLDVIENSLNFKISTFTGQKTGWFYDQYYNRARLLPYVRGKKVLDVFSYVGAWGIQAAVMGAKEVLCVDSSESALSLVRENAAKNNVSEQVAVKQGDAFDCLQALQVEQSQFDVVILDPPAFIKKRKDSQPGTKAYQRLNELGMALVKEGGFLITASCSLHFSEEELIDAVRRAGLKLNRFVQIIERGGQGPDHPVHPAIAETAYLKTVFCRVW